MSTRAKLCGLALVAGLCVAAVAAAASNQVAQEPLGATRLLVLVAGDVLPENLVAAVNARGLSFTPSEDYRTSLKEAGATPELLKAISHATIRNGGEDEESTHAAQIWLHLATAGKLIRSKEFKEAETELNEAMREGGPKLDAGFVMGEALRRQEEWEEAAAVYTEILKEDEHFPEAQTKLSYLLYRMGDGDEAFRAAKAALEVTPNNAEAHKNAGLGLEVMLKYDAAVAEYQEALRLKPDYAYVRLDLGILLYKKNDFDGAIEEFKKALTLDPKNVDTRINMANAYEQKGDGLTAIRLLREAKELAPDNFRVRQDLGSVLIQQNMNADAVVELRELEKIAPESVVCHQCLGAALYNTMDYEGAKKEFYIAIRLDPTDSVSYRELGRIEEAQENYEKALEKYREAEEIDGSSVETHLCIGRVLLIKKLPKLAAQELQIAVKLDPGNDEVHKEYGETLEALGKMEQAKEEFKVALQLDSDNVFAILDLARVQEKQGDWVGAMANYHLAARKVDATLVNRRSPQTVADAPGALQAARLRFNQHLAELRSAGKSKEADELEARVEGRTADQGISQKLDAAMEAGAEAYRDRRFDEAERSYQTAAKLAEQLHPHDDRLVMSLGFLSSLYYYRKDLRDSQAAMEKQLKAAEEVYGANSPQMSPVLEALARVSVELGDHAKGESLAQQDLALTAKSTGEKSMNYTASLMTMGFVYSGEKQYEKAIPYFEKAVKNYEDLSGPQELTLMSAEMVLCRTYDSAAQPAKSEACDKKVLVLMEKYYGKANPALAPFLDSQAKALRKLGRNSEAEAVEQRLHELQQPVAGTN